MSTLTPRVRVKLRATRPTDICPLFRPDSIQITPPNQWFKLEMVEYTQFHICTQLWEGLVPLWPPGPFVLCLYYLPPCKALPSISKVHHFCPAVTQILCSHDSSAKMSVNSYLQIKCTQLSHSAGTRPNNCSVFLKTHSGQVRIYCSFIFLNITQSHLL